MFHESFEGPSLWQAINSVRNFDFVKLEAHVALQRGYPGRTDEIRVVAVVDDSRGCRDGSQRCHSGRPTRRARKIDIVRLEDDNDIPAGGCVCHRCTEVSHSSAMRKVDRSKDYHRLFASQPEERFPLLVIVSELRLPRRERTRADRQISCRRIEFDRPCDFQIPAYFEFLGWVGRPYSNLSVVIDDNQRVAGGAFYFEYRLTGRDVEQSHNTCNDTDKRLQSSFHCFSPSRCYGSLRRAVGSGLEGVDAACSAPRVFMFVLRLSPVLFQSFLILSITMVE